VHCCTPFDRLRQAYLKVAAAEQQVDLDALAALGLLDGRVDGVQLAMAAALHRDLSRT